MCGKSRTGGSEVDSAAYWLLPALSFCVLIHKTGWSPFGCSEGSHHVGKTRVSGSWVVVVVLVTQTCPTLCNPMDCSTPGSCVHGILQARIPQWVAIPFSRGYSRPRDRTWVSCIAGRLFTISATRELLAPEKSFKNRKMGIRSWRVSPEMVFSTRQKLSSTERDASRRTQSHCSQCSYQDLNLGPTVREP